MKKHMLAFLILSTAACAGSRAPVAAPEEHTITVTEWPRRDASAPLWPETAQRVQVIVTGGWSADEIFMWVIAEGTPVVVYHGKATDLADMSSRISEVMTKVSRFSFGNGGQGFQIGRHPLPPPPSPPPIGFPSRVVDAVVNFAKGIDRETSTFERAISSGAAPAR